MSSNGFPRGGRSGRTPHFLTVGLLVVICILAFNYWNVSSQNKILQGENAKMRDNIEELVLRKVHLEKRTEALNQELQSNNNVVHDTQEKANTCHLSLRELGDERDRLQSKVSQFELEVKELHQSLEDCNDTMDQEQDELRELRDEKRKLEDQLYDLDSQLALLHKEVQTKDEQLSLAQVEIKHHKAEVETLKQQQQQQQQLHQQQQIKQYNPNAVGQQQGVYQPQQPQQNTYLRPGNQEQQLGAGNQQLPLRNLIPPGNLVPGNPQAPGNQQPQLQQPLSGGNNRAPILVPKLNIPNMPDIKLPGLSDEGQKENHGQENEAQRETGAEAQQDKDIEAEKPSDSLHIEDKDNPNSPDNEGKNFIHNGIRNEDDRGLNRETAFHQQEEDSQPLENANGVSNMDSPVEDERENPEDPGNGIDDQQSPGKENEFKFIGQKDDFDDEEEEESSESDYEYEDDEKKGDTNKEGLEEIENEIVPGNMKDYNAENAEGVFPQLELPNIEIDAADDHHLRFNPGG